MSASLKIANNAIILNNDEIYQVSNITAVTIEKLPRKIPKVFSTSVILGFLTFGLIILKYSKYFEYGAIICLFSSGCLLIDLTSARKTKLSLHLNNSTSKSFITSDGQGLKTIELMKQK